MIVRIVIVSFSLISAPLRNCIIIVDGWLCALQSIWWLPDSLTPLVQITIQPSHPATQPPDTSHSDHLSCPLSPEIITERARRLNVLSHLTTHILPKDNIIAVQSLLWIMRGTRFMDFVRWIWDERDTRRDSHKERLWKGYLINYYKTRDKRPTTKLNNENIIDFPAGQTEASF